jgi:hypothetical protein
MEERDPSLRDSCSFLFFPFLRAPTNPVATLPSALFVSDFCFARCKLGVLVSAGAATCLSTSLPSRDGSWARPLTQSPEPALGAVLPIRESETMRLPAIAPLGCCAVVRKPLRSPTSDAATPPAFVRSQSPLISFHSSPRAPPTSAPSAADRCPLQTVLGLFMTHLDLQLGKL